MALFSSRAIPKWLLPHIATLLTFLGFSLSAAQALPPPFSPEELTARSDLVIEGRVTKVWLYPQWLTYLKEGGLGTTGMTILKEVPATEEGMLHLIRNFPYKSLQGVQVEVDVIHLAEVHMEKSLKGQAAKVIFIPFLRYHFLNGFLPAGPWTERTYHEGERRKMYLRKNGPFFESTYWNAVRPLDTKGLDDKNH